MKNIKLLLLTAVASLFATSCLVDDEVNSIVTPANTPYIIGFDNSGATESYFADEGTIEKGYPLSLKGTPTGENSTSDIIIDYVMDPSSTAVEGQEFDFVDASGQLTIPANSNYALLPININTGSFDPIAPTELVLKISTTANNTVVSQQYETLTIKFVGCLSTVDTASYDVSIEYTAVSGAVTNYTNYGESFTGTGTPNNFITETSGHWTPGQLSPGADGFYFEDICGDIFIYNQQLGGYWGNTVEGYLGSENAAGSVDPITGDIHMEYNVCFGGDCRKYKVDYTKL